MRLAEVRWDGFDAYAKIVPIGRDATSNESSSRMRRIATTVLATVAVLPICLSAATPAAAVDTSVTADFTTAGNSITGTFTSTRERPIRCILIGLDDPYDPSREYLEEDVAFYFGPFDIPAKESGTVTAADLTVGEDYFLDWACLELPPTTETFATMGWGTWILQDPFEPTAQTSRVVVGETTPPEGSPCTGSVCLPTGSFGI